MREYDLTVMVAVTEGAEDAKALETRVEKVIKALDGKVVKAIEMGKKQLAYKIKNVREAVFFNWKIELPPASVVQLDKKLAVDRSVLRHLLVLED